MNSLLRRLEKLEQQVATTECICVAGLPIHYEGDPEPEPRNCPRHGLQEVMRVSYVASLRALDS
jgi:hypothetical protein